MNFWRSLPEIRWQSCLSPGPVADAALDNLGEASDHGVGATMIYTRRDIGKLALLALPATRSWAAKPNSVFGGVQVGINAPYSFHNIPGGADDILNLSLIHISEPTRLG